MSEWRQYQRKGLSEMRPYVPGEDLTGISVSDVDRAAMREDARWGMTTGGYVARNPKNHADQWYVSQGYFDENLEPADTPARDDAAELRAALAEVMRVIGQHDDRGPHILPTPVWQRARAALAATEGSE